MRKVSVVLLVVLLFSASVPAGAQDTFSPLTVENAYRTNLIDYLTRGRVTDIDWSPDGRWLAAASSSGVWVYDTRTWQPRHFEGHTNLVHAVKFSPDSTLLASGSGGVIDGEYTSDFYRTEDNAVRVWDVERGQQLFTLPHEMGVTALDFSPDGRTLASGSFDGKIRLWDLESRDLHTVMDMGASDLNFGYGPSVSDVEFSPAGDMLASSNGLNLQLWDTDGTLLGGVYGEFGAAGPGVYIAFSPDRQRLTSSGFGYVAEDTYTYIWDVAELLDKQSLSLADAAMRLPTVGKPLFSPEGTSLAVGQSLLDAETGELQISLLNELDRESPRATAGAEETESPLEPAAAFNPTGDALAFTYQGSVRVWNLSTHELITVLEPTILRAPTHLLFSPDSRLLAAVNGRGRTVIWDVASRAAVRIFTSELLYPEYLAFSTDSRLLAVANEFSGSVWVWELSTGGMIGTWETDADIRQIAFIPNTTTLAVLDDEGVATLWIPAEDDQRRFALPAGQHAAALVPDGEYLRIAAQDEGYTVYLYDLMSGETALSFAFDAPIHQAVLSQRREIPVFAVLGLESARLWLLRQQETRQFDVAFPESLSFDNAQLSPNGYHVVNPISTYVEGGSVGVDFPFPVNTVYIWPIFFQGCCMEALHHGGVIRSLAFNLSSTLLATGSAASISQGRNMIRLWDLTTGAPLAVLSDDATGVEQVTFSPDGTLLASANQDGTIRLWGVAN